MDRALLPGCRLALLCLLVATAAAHGNDAFAQDEALIDRPVSVVEIDGLERVPRQLVVNQVRTTIGDPYDPDIVRGDVRRLTRLAEFRHVDVTAEVLDDGTVAVTFTLDEMPILNGVQVVGNRLIDDQQLKGVIGMRAGDPRDDFRIEKAKRSVEALYRQRGHYLTTVTIDRQELEESSLLIFRIIEGSRVKVRSVAFEGNAAIPSELLDGEVKTSTAFPILRRGELDEERLIDDVASLDRFYKGRGYLDVRVDKRIDLSPDNREAKVTFLIVEGDRYTLRSVRAVTRVGGRRRPLRVFAEDQIAALLEIQTGDVYEREKIDRSLAIVRESYGRLGYLDVGVQAFEIRSGETPEVDLLLEIEEGRQYKVGLVQIAGNSLTRDRVIRRQVRLQPGRPFDAAELDKSERLIRGTRLFSEARVTVQPPDPDSPEHRDVLVEVKETNTGRFNFGLGFGSDLGEFGEFRLSQSNFDIHDPPESFRELITGRAFRGGGQQFSMVLQPGDEIFLYRLSWTEPRFAETEYSFGVSGQFFQREFDDYDEERVSGSMSLGRRIGDIWNLGFRTRVENVELTNIDPTAPIEFFRDAGPDTIIGQSVSLTRTTIDRIGRPSRGSRLELAYETVGLFGGDVDFNSITADYTVFVTLSEDFLGRIATLRLNGRVGYIFSGRAPTYERYYLGGSSLRGFDFRTVSPKGFSTLTGLPTDDSIGGNWLVFLGVQYEFPIYEDSLTGVLFVDSGTVLEDPGLDDYRIAVGGGFRLYLPQLFGAVPFGIDLAFPIKKEDRDEERVVNLTFELPFSRGGRYTLSN